MPNKITIPVNVDEQGADYIFIESADKITLAGRDSEEPIELKELSRSILLDMVKYFINVGS